MTEIAIRDATGADFDAIVALNAAEVDKTSPMDAMRLAELARLSGHCRVAEADGRVAAFVLAMRDSAAYANANFEWFSARLPGRFLYVDRIVVGTAFFGRGIGTRLYEDLFAVARSQGVATVACEYNIVPPNVASRRFHGKFGFRELGRQWLVGGAKQVSMQTLELVPAGGNGAR